MDKVISIQQPFAQTVCLGIKKIETRSWVTKHRGLLLIHATMRADFTAMEWFYQKPLSRYREAISKDMQLGAIIGSVMLMGIKPAIELIPNLTPVEKALGYYANDSFGWILEEPKLFDKPIFMRGQQGLWSFDMEEVQHG